LWNSTGKEVGRAQFTDGQAKIELASTLK